MFPRTDSLAYIQIFVRHIECEILKAISEESVGWTKVILIDNLAERATQFCNCILFRESNHGCLFISTMILFRKFSTWFDVNFLIVRPTLSSFVFSSYLELKKIVFLALIYFQVFFEKFNLYWKLLAQFPFFTIHLIFSKKWTSIL